MQKLLDKFAHEFKTRGHEIPFEELKDIFLAAMDGGTTTLQVEIVREPLLKSEDVLNMRALAMRTVFGAIVTRPELTEVKSTLTSDSEKGVVSKKLHEQIRVCLINLSDAAAE